MPPRHYGKGDGAEVIKCGGFIAGIMENIHRAVAKMRSAISIIPTGTNETVAFLLLSFLIYTTIENGDKL